MIREDIDYLLHNSCEDFTLIEALEGYHALQNCADDIRFQLSVPEEEFRGQDYSTWRKRTNYKLNRVTEAARRLSLKYRELKEAGAQAKIDKALAYIEEFSHYQSSIAAVELILKNG